MAISGEYTSKLMMGNGDHLPNYKVDFNKESFRNKIQGRGWTKGLREALI